MLISTRPKKKGKKKEKRERVNLIPELSNCFGFGWWVGLRLAPLDLYTGETLFKITKASYQINGSDEPTKKPSIL